MTPRHRSAETGEYVDEATAAAHPDTTVEEQPGRSAIKAFDRAAEQLLSASPLEGLTPSVSKLRELFLHELYDRR